MVPVPACGVQDWCCRGSSCSPAGTINGLTLSWHSPASRLAGGVAVGGRLGSWGLFALAGGAGGWQCWQQGPGHPGSRVSQRDPPGAPAAAGGRRDAWSSVPLGPVSMGLGARSGGMAAASPSSATAQPGCPAVQGIPPFHPFLPDVLMEAPRPPAKGWVALLRLPCRQNPGMLPHPSQPRVPVLNLAALAVSLALQEGDPLPRTGVTPGFISLAHPRGKEMEAWHSMAPMAPCPSCLSAPSVAGLSEGDPWILATGKPQESHQSLPEAWAPPLLSPGAGEPLPTPAGPAHASTSKPLWDAAWGIWTQSHLSGDTHGKGLWIILCCAPCLGQCEPLDVSRQSQPWVRGASVQPLAPLTPNPAAAG